MTKLETLQFIKAWYGENRAALQSQPALVSAIKADYKIESAIHDLYLALFNKALGGCGSCLADAVAELYHYPEAKLLAIMEAKFKLKSGVLLCDATGALPHVTAANLTDELAIAYLRDNRARIDLFAVVPDNLEELLSATEKVAQIEEKPAKTRKRKA